jgi:hypothetical protein
VLSYDSTLGRYVPVNRAKVTLEPGSATMTDLTGRYLFRDLASGFYTIAVAEQSRRVRLGAQPVDLKDVDFQISRPSETSTPH